MKKMLLASASLAFSVLAATTTPTTPIEDPVAQYKNSVSSNPFGLMNGLNMNYESLLTKNSALVGEAGVVLWNPDVKGFAVGGHYRHHYHTKKNHRGLNSPFFGPFISYENSSGVAKDDDDITFSLNALKVGANWGRKWVWSTGFNLTFRIGYGVFPMFSVDWDDPKNTLSDDAKDFVENVSKGIGGVDGELSIGMAF